MVFGVQVTGIELNGGKKYERNHAAPLRDQFWGAFVGADPPEEVPVHPSGEI